MGKPYVNDAGIVRVLSIDGGGVRGYLPALLLAEIERRAGRPAHELFDLVVGTSTGAIIGIGLAARQSAAELAEFYPRFGRRIFGEVPRRGLLTRALRRTSPAIWDTPAIFAIAGGNARFNGNARHDPQGLEEALAEVLGTTRLSEVSTELAVTTFDRLQALPVVLSSRDARADPAYDLLLRDVARATSAAPTYFPPLKTTFAGEEREFVDGGVWANNPSAVAMSESIALTSARRLTGQSVVVASLGTGIDPARPLLDGNDTWLGTARDLAGLATSVWAGEVLARRAVGEDRLRRFQVLDSRVAGAMNDPSVERLAILKDAAELMIARESAAIDALIIELSD